MGNHKSHTSVLAIVSLGFVAFALTLVLRPSVPASSDTAPCTSSLGAGAGVPAGGMIIGENPTVGDVSGAAVGGDAGKPAVHALPNGGFLMLTRGTLTHYMVATSEMGADTGSGISTNCRRDAALIAK